MWPTPEGEELRCPPPSSTYGLQKLKAEYLARAGMDHVMAYLIKPVKPVDLQAAISLAILRFEHFQNLRREAASLRQAGGGEATDEEVMAGSLGRLWGAGVEVDWQRYASPERRRRVALPTYPFQRQRYWIDMKDRSDSDFTRRAASEKNQRSSRGLP